MATSGTLALTRFEDVDAFEDRALPFLLEREAEHNLFIGICGQIREGRYTEAYLATVECDGRVVAAAWRTPPHNLGISHLGERDGVLELLARDVLARFTLIPGVLAAKPDARRFVEIWTSLTGQTANLATAQRIYVATTAEMPTGVAGAQRRATPAERSLLIDWHVAFNDEALGIVGDPGTNVDYRLDGTPTRGLLLWHDDRPVCMAGFGGPTPNGIRVAPVYTPPKLRGRGYATACVATLTQQLLDEGRRFCFLYTDLSNSTSNSIYQKIGYRPVCDVDQYLFD